MELDRIYVGVITEIDAENMLAKAVIYGPEDFPTDWLMLATQSGFYYIPAEGDQCFIGMDEHMNDGIIMGYVNNLKPYGAALTLGIKFPGVEIEIARDAGTARIKLTGDATMEMPNLSIKGNVKIQGDIEIDGKSKITGDVTMSKKLDVIGIIKSTTDVQTATVKLNTHLHVSAAPGSPTTPPTPGT